MSRWCPKTLLVAMAVGLAGLVSRAAAADDWKFDVVFLKNGKQIKGLLLEQTPAGIEFRMVTRRRGAPTIVNPTSIEHRLVDHLELLGAADRELLEGRLASLRRDRDVSEMVKSLLSPPYKLPDKESDRFADIDLKKVAWVLDGKGPATSYESEHFRLISDADPCFVYLAIVHLEQIYTAYSSFLPPRISAGQPTTILLPRSRAEYQALLKEEKVQLLNPAYYDPTGNRILCCFDLPEIHARLKATHDEHRQTLDQLQSTEADLKQKFKGKVPALVMKGIIDTRKEIAAAEKQNAESAQAAARRLFRMLYHEALHAYLAMFVYPAGEGEVPRWLNEGLAQIFEGAIVEAGELRVERPDADRLQRVQGLIRDKQIVGVGELLKSGPKDFIVVHGSDRQTSDRNYLTSWALAYYLTFDRKLLGTKALDDYVQSLGHGVDAAEAFRTLVGMPLADFETRFRAYLLRLQADGRLGRSAAMK
jgi:hypothetical protein